MEMPENISDESIEISNDIRLEAKRAMSGESQEKKQPWPLEEYVAACHELLETYQPLTEGNLEATVAYLQDAAKAKVMVGSEQWAKMKVVLPEGYRLCIAVVPCSIYGHRLDEKAVKDGEQVHNLIIDPSGRVVRGFTSQTSDLYSMMPDEVRDACTIEIGKYKPGATSELADEDRDRIINSYIEAYRRAQKIFNS